MTFLSGQRIGHVGQRVTVFYRRPLYFNFAPPAGRRVVSVPRKTKSRRSDQTRHTQLKNDGVFEGRGEIGDGRGMRSMRADLHAGSAGTRVGLFNLGFGLLFQLVPHKRFQHHALCFLSPTQRVIGFGICFVIGWIITVAVRFVLQCRPKRFSARTDGNIYLPTSSMHSQCFPPVSLSHSIASFCRRKLQSMFFLKDLKKFAIMYSIGSITAIARFVHTFSAVIVFVGRPCSSASLPTPLSVSFDVLMFNH
jgi:hypothetical protein